MEKIIKLCRKEVTVGDKTFPTLFAYKTMKNDKGEIVTLTVPSTDEKGTPIMKAKSFKVALAEELFNTLEKENKYPYLVTIDEDLKLADGRDSFYITVDKDKNGDVRYDKYNHKHPIMVIRAVKHYEQAPKTSISFEDIDTFD